MNHYIMKNIRGTIPEAPFCGWWDNRFLMVRDRRVFLDANPALFRALVEYLNKQIYPIKPYVGNGDFNSLWQIILAFGLEYYGVENAKESI